MKIFVMAAAALATGCAMGWTRPSTTEAEFSRDRFECEREAAGMYPAMPVASGYQAPARTECHTYGNQTSCSTTPGTASTSTRDANAINRNNAQASCMRSRGYTFQVRN